MTVFQLRVTMTKMTSTPHLTLSSSVSRATTQHTKEEIMEMGQLLGPNPTFPISGESAATTLVCVEPTNGAKCTPETP
jgi:hypothetical protein